MTSNICFEADHQPGFSSNAAVQVWSTARFRAVIKKPEAISASPPTTKIPSNERPKNRKLVARRTGDARPGIPGCARTGKSACATSSSAKARGYLQRGRMPGGRIESLSSAGRLSIFQFPVSSFSSCQFCFSSFDFRPGGASRLRARLGHRVRGWPAKWNCNYCAATRKLPIVEACSRANFLEGDFWTAWAVGVYPFKSLHVTFPSFVDIYSESLLTCWAWRTSVLAQDRCASYTEG